MSQKLFCFGLGYTASAFARHCVHAGWQVTGTTRRPERAEQLRAGGITPVLFDARAPDETGQAAVRRALEEASHVLMSAGPDAEGDPFLDHFEADIIERAPALEWAGYLSTIGVYGDHQGAWIDETAPVVAVSPRIKWRIAAEQRWLALQAQHRLPLHIFRLAGIYGPGRSPLDKLRSGRARRIVKKGQVFNRIHVDDIVQTLAASILHPAPGTVYNVTDGEPAPPQDVTEFAAGLLGIDPPPAEDFETTDMTPMARSFYSGNRRISNRAIREQLGVTLRYPSYQQGLRAILDAETHAGAAS